MTEIHLDDQAGRFSSNVEDHDCVLEFVREDNIVSINSVRVPDAVTGRGMAGQLTRHALDWVRAEGLTVIPVCPYVSAWIRRHPDYQDLLV